MISLKSPREIALMKEAGAIVAKDEYGIEDEDILNAIRFHTVGRPNMSLLEKIIYIADFISRPSEFYH